MRYLKVTLFIGILTVLIVAGLDSMGVFRQLDLGLGTFLGVRFSPVVEPFTQYALVTLFAFGIAWTTVDIPRTSLKVVIALGALGELIAAVWVLDLFGIFFSPFRSATAIVVSFFLGFLYSQSAAGSRKKVVRAVFGDRISQKSFATLIDNDIPLRFGGDLRDATVVICEIFNHDQLAEALPVTDYVAVNNSFLRNAADFLVERGGYLDECDGESLRVVFGTPVPDAQHAATACDAALALTERLNAVNAECYRMWKQTFDFRIGVNSGEVVVAAYGSRRLGAFSVAGEPVEWARRLCAANLLYGSRILIGSQTFQQAEERVEVRPMELVRRHPNDRQREEIYELLHHRNGLSEEEQARRDLFWKGIVYYRSEQWEEALAHFLLASAPDRHDGPAEFYLRRIEQTREGRPALEWNGTPL